MNAPATFPVEIRVAPAAIGAWPRWPWICLALLASVEAVWILATPLTLDEATATLILQLACSVGAMLILAQRFADKPRLYSLCAGGAFLFAAWPVLRLFNHLTMTTAFPLADPLLASWDAAIGFDWLAYVRWADSNGLLLHAMDLSYNGLTGYSCLIFLLLALGRDPERRCLELIILFLVTAIACSSMGLFFPAAAALSHYAPPPELFERIQPGTGLYHLASLESLRNNSAHMFDLRSMPGLVTFPSFHTALGVVAIYCARGTPWLFAPSLAVNLLMIASTPVFGSHYGVDILAGAAVAGAAILALRQTQKRRRPTSPRRSLADWRSASAQLE